MWGLGLGAGGRGSALEIFRLCMCGSVSPRFGCLGRFRKYWASSTGKFSDMLGLDWGRFRQMEDEGKCWTMMVVSIAGVLCWGVDGNRRWLSKWFRRNGLVEGIGWSGS